MSAEARDSNRKIIERYTGQPVRLPRDLRARIERSWGGLPVQLYAMADLDASMQLGQIWVALGPRHPDDRLEIMHEQYGYKSESIARFPQFSALRISLAAGAEYSHLMNRYALVMGISGEVSVNDVPLLPEQGHLLPAGIKSLTLSAASDAVVLLAEPNLDPT